MPYTPPSARSPVGSRPETPRSNSFSTTEVERSNANVAAISCSKKELPHSASSKAYLSKHRRSPTVSESTGLNFDALDHADGESISSPRKTTQVTNAEPSGPSKPLQESPAGSPPSSGDDEPVLARGRGRDVANLAELQAAIRIIEQHREGSPTDDGIVIKIEENKEARSILGLPMPRLDPSVKINGTSSHAKPVRPPLSESARKISHSRSSTDASAFLDFPKHKFESPLNSASVSDGDDDDDEEELKEKPNLIRKKSGELVRPALRASSTRRRPSSMPGTPTYSKAVHFQENSLEHVRHFLQVDRPIAVSAGSSPVETYEDDMEFPFGEPKPVSTSYEWEIKLVNFPQASVNRTSPPVKVERVFLSPNTKILIGSVAARNLAFHKFVVARFTLDYWKTTSEVVAEYNNDVRKKYANDGYDRFNFNIKLEDQANLEQKSMFFCIRYNVNGQEYWDNNNSLNYQVDFTKKYKAQGGKNGRQPNSLPRSKSPNDFSPKMRPRSMPSFDDFASSGGPYDFSSFPHPSSMIGESPIRFKNKPPSSTFLPGAPAKPKASTNQQAFGNRYDFGASLSAAIQAASNQIGERGDSNDLEDIPVKSQLSSSAANGNAQKENANVKPDTAEVTKPSALTAQKPPLQSTSYHELLDRYCFFGSGKPVSSPPKPKPASAPIEATTQKPQKGAKPATKPGSEKSAESTTLTSPRVASPTPDERTSKSSSSRASRSASPATGSAYGSRAASPGAFGYPYHQRMQTGFFETQTPTAIHG